MIAADEKRLLERFLPVEVRRHGGELLAVGVVCDHVHILVRLPKRFDLPRLLQGLKGGSARASSVDPEVRGGVRWAKGYTATTVSPRALPRAIEYVRAQATRHPDRAIKE